MDNPYLAMYKSLNMLHAGAPVDKKVAHALSVQLAMLHQTLGSVMRDIVQVLSVQFDMPVPSHVPTEECPKGKQKHSVSPASLSAKNSKKAKTARPPTQIRSDPLPLSKRHFAIPAKSPAARISEVDDDIDETHSGDKHSLPIEKQESRQKSEPDGSENGSKRAQPITTNNHPQHKTVLEVEHKRGVSCNMCEKFYEATGIEVHDDSQACSRHRAAVAPSRLPSFTQHFEI